MNLLQLCNPMGMLIHSEKNGFASHKPMYKVIPYLFWSMGYILFLSYDLCNPMGMLIHSEKMDSLVINLCIK